MAILVDWRPAYLARTPGSSLLTCAFAGSSLLQYFARLLDRDNLSCDIVVSPRFQPDEGYGARLKALCPDVRVQDRDNIYEAVCELEPTDSVLIIDPVLFPEAGLDLESLAREVANRRMPTHVVPQGEGDGVVRERIIMDGRQRIRRIQRYYAGVTDLNGSGVVASWVPAVSLRPLYDLSRYSPTEIRQQLSQHHLPASDLALHVETFDLRDESEFLRLSESALQGNVPGFVVGLGMRNLADDIWVARDARIDASARLYGPIVLGAGSFIAHDAVVVGPVVIGNRCGIEDGAFVNNAVVHSDVTVPAGAVVHDRVITTNIAVEPVAFRPTGGAGARRRGLDTSIDGANGTTKPSTAARTAHAIVKRALDVTVASIGLIAFAPLMLLTAILIKATSRGTVLFAHVREGKDGREFKCWKFRTMAPDAHARQRALYKQNEVDGPQFNLARDPRITPVGHYLRRSNIDELPQLFNVLRGDMSLIGPRPSPFRENQICVPWRQARLSVRPGITGLWQVCRNERAAGDFHQWIHFDMMYVQNLSVWLDLKILAATIFTLGGRFSVPARWMVPDGDSTTPRGMDDVVSAIPPDALRLATGWYAADPVAPRDDASEAGRPESSAGPSTHDAQAPAMRPSLLTKHRYDQ